ncbi:hypothetical protein NGRA_1770 [Nosema granulosis]|uniref:Uncharacterized protein n=1 Tax=Nosema granulosis TaxID=83296 RepID=A0A9P6GYT1_9MICR|nr:hypothetical protein NGRA_1770 [Nosema granulosis]
MLLLMVLSKCSSHFNIEGDSDSSRYSPRGETEEDLQIDEENTPDRISKALGLSFTEYKGLNVDDTDLIAGIDFRDDEEIFPELQVNLSETHSEYLQHLKEIKEKYGECSNQISCDNNMRVSSHLLTPVSNFSIRENNDTFLKRRVTNDIIFGDPSYTSKFDFKNKEINIREESPKNNLPSGNSLIPIKFSFKNRYDINTEENEISDHIILKDLPHDESSSTINFELKERGTIKKDNINDEKTPFHVLSKAYSYNERSAKVEKRRSNFQNEMFNEEMSLKQPKNKVVKESSKDEFSAFTIPSSSFEEQQPIDLSKTGSFGKKSSEDEKSTPSIEKEASNDGSYMTRYSTINYPTAAINLSKKQDRHIINSYDAKIFFVMMRMCQDLLNKNNQSVAKFKSEYQTCLDPDKDEKYSRIFLLTDSVVEPLKGVLAEVTDFLESQIKNNEVRNLFMSCNRYDFISQESFNSLSTEAKFEYGRILTSITIDPIGIDIIERCKTAFRKSTEYYNTLGKLINN